MLVEKQEEVERQIEVRHTIRPISRHTLKFAKGSDPIHLHEE